MFLLSFIQEDWDKKFSNQYSCVVGRGGLTLKSFKLGWKFKSGLKLLYIRSQRSHIMCTMNLYCPGQTFCDDLGLNSIGSEPVTKQFRDRLATGSQQAQG